jgi:hypothetical protein
MDLPIPEFHLNERYYKRLSYKPNRILNTHNCKNCDTETLSVYEKEQNILCEKCYDEKVN